MSFAQITSLPSERESYKILSMDKKVLRRKALSCRRSLSKEKIEKKSEKIKERLFNLSVFKQAKVVLFYLSLPEEVQTYSMIKAAFRINKRVALPVVKNVNRREIIPFEIKNPEPELILGPFKIPQPKPSECYPLSLEEIDLVVVPGVAFDERGNRLGFGAGFYDRFLKKLTHQTKFVGLAFECQLTDKIPSEKHDISMDYVVTEERVISCFSKK